MILDSVLIEGHFDTLIECYNEEQFQEGDYVDTELFNNENRNRRVFAMMKGKRTEGGA